MTNLLKKDDREGFEQACRVMLTKTDLAKEGTQFSALDNEWFHAIIKLKVALREMVDLDKNIEERAERRQMDSKQVCDHILENFNRTEEKG